MRTKLGSDFDVSPYIPMMQRHMTAGTGPQKSTSTSTMTQPGQVDLGGAMNPLMMYLMMQQFFKPETGLPAGEGPSVGQFNTLLGIIANMLNPTNPAPW